MDQGKIHVTLVILKPVMGSNDPSSTDILFQRTSSQNVARLPFLRFRKSSFDQEVHNMTRNRAVLANAISVASKFFGEGQCGSQPKITLEIPVQKVLHEARARQEQVKHNIDEHGICSICIKCLVCSGYGRNCCNCGSRDRTSDRGKACGCGSGRGICKGCGMCRTCCDASSNEYCSLDISICMTICDVNCVRSHENDGNCLLCGQDWFAHSGHDCSSGIRGSWRSGGGGGGGGSAMTADFLHVGSFSGCGGNPQGFTNCQGGGNCGPACRDCGAHTHWNCCGDTDKSSKTCLPGITREQATRNTQILSTMNAPQRIAEISGVSFTPSALPVTSALPTDETLLPPGLILAWNQPDRYEILEVKRSMTIDGNVSLLSDYYLVYLLDAMDDAEFITDWKPRAAMNTRDFIDDGQPDHGCFWTNLRPDILVPGADDQLLPAIKGMEHVFLLGPTKHLLKHHIDEILSARATLMRNMALRNASHIPAPVNPLELQNLIELNTRPIDTVNQITSEDILISLGGGITEAHAAAYFGNIEKLAALKQTEGFDLNIRDHRGHTPLHYAVYGNSLAGFQYLIEAGAGWHFVNDKRRNVLDVIFKRRPTMNYETYCQSSHLPCKAQEKLICVHLEDTQAYAISFDSRSGFHENSLNVLKFTRRDGSELWSYNGSGTLPGVESTPLLVINEREFYVTFKYSSKGRDDYGYKFRASQYEPFDPSSTTKVIPGIHDGEWRDHTVTHTRFNCALEVHPESMADSMHPCKHTDPVKESHWSCCGSTNRLSNGCKTITAVYGCYCDDYGNNIDIKTTIAVPGATSFVITFDMNSKTEAGCDLLEFYEDELMTKRIGTYSGNSFPGLIGVPPLVINAAVCYTRFKTDGSGCYRDNSSYWGYRFTCQGQHSMAIAPPSAPMTHVARLNSSVEADSQLVEYAQTRLLGRMSIDYPVEQKWAVSRHRYNGPYRSLDKIVEMSGWNDLKSEAYKIALQVLQPRETLDLPPHHIMIMGNKGSGKTSASKLIAELLIETGIRYGKIYFIDGYDAADDPDKFLKDIQEDTVSVVVIDDVEDFEKTKQSGGVGGKIGDLRRFMDLNKSTKTLIITGSDPKMVDNNFLSVHPSFRSLFSHSVTLPNFTGVQIQDLFTKEMQKHKLVAEPTEPGGVSLTTVCVALLAEFAKTDRSNFSNAHAVIQFFDRGFKNARMRMEYSDLSGRDLYVLKKQDFVAAPIDPSSSPTFVKLMKMVGLEAVKEALLDIVNGAKNDYNNRIRGLPCTPKAFHRAFVGKPGTGKTTIAQLYGQILSEMNILSCFNSEPEVVMASSLIGSAVGVTANNLNALFDRSKGKVVVIDEIHQFAAPGYGSSEGKDVIVSRVQEFSDFVLIVCGYEDKVPAFMNLDAGIPARFRYGDGSGAVKFESYSQEELSKIMVSMGRERFSMFISEELARETVSHALGPRMGRREFRNADEVRLHLICCLDRKLKKGNATYEGPLMVMEQEDLYQAQPSSDDIFAMLKKRGGMQNILEEMEKIKAMVETDKAICANSKPPIPYPNEEMKEKFFKGYFLLGPTGVGKSTGADYVAKSFYQFGILATDRVTKTSAMDLGTGIMGKSKEKLENFMESSIGGILLIDEAYMLLDNASGHEVLNRLVEAMEEVKYKNKLMVWMAGYGPETPNKNLFELFRFNTGFSERFPKQIRFPPWTSDNCLKLLEDTLRKKFTLAFPDKNAKDSIGSILAEEFYGLSNICMEMVHRHPAFGNARTMINLADVVYEKFCVRNSMNPVKSFLVAAKDIEQAFDDWLSSRDESIGCGGAFSQQTTLKQHNMNT